MAEETYTMIGKYPIVRRVGQGGMGDVWLGDHPELGVPVAIKVMRPEVMALVQDAEERFFREVRTVAQVNHPNVVRVYDAGKHDDRCYMVMEYVPGGSALDLLVGAPYGIPPEQVLRIGIDMARALVAAGERHIVHRDIKPENIMLDENGMGKLADLGLAKEIVNATMCQLTSTGMVFGTPCYMAPEQAVDTKNVTHSADIYSLGCTLYQLATGELPYDSMVALQLVEMHLRHPIPVACETNSAVPEALSSAIYTMMEKAPADRYADAAELLAALEAVRDGAAAPAPRATQVVPAAAVAPATRVAARSMATMAQPTQPDHTGAQPAPTIMHTPPSQVSTWSRGQIVIMAAVSLGVAAVIVAAVVIVMQHASQADPVPVVVETPPVSLNTAETPPLEPPTTIAPTPPVVVEPEPEPEPEPVALPVYNPNDGLEIDPDPEPEPDPVATPFTTAAETPTATGTAASLPVRTSGKKGTLAGSNAPPQWQNGVLALQDFVGVFTGAIALDPTVAGWAPTVNGKAPTSYIALSGTTSLAWEIPPMPGGGKVIVTLVGVAGTTQVELSVDGKSVKRSEVAAGQTVSWSVDIGSGHFRALSISSSGGSVALCDGYVTGGPKSKR